MFRLLIVFVLSLSTLTFATEVKKCGPNIPFPLNVTVIGCDVPPCDIIKGTNVDFRVTILADKFITKATTLVKAKVLGLTRPYELPEDVKDVCSNLMYEANCPLYVGEDVTYLFLFPISSYYPEIPVNIQIYIVDQDADFVTCFKCDIKVKQGPNHANSETVYQLNWLN